MLYNGQNGKTLVSDNFNENCVDCKVEATIQAFPNPGDVMKAMRLITFRNFSDQTVKVIRISGKIDMIPGKGTVQIMLMPDDELPKLERIE
jgi:hypothetical protein